MTAIQPVSSLTPRRAPEEDVPTYDARELVREGVQARIILDDQFYWLRITRAGKLILTK
ncbi:MAG: hemin uptake protein HemP [Pseudomonadota bacterium]